MTPDRTGRRPAPVGPTGVPASGPAPTPVPNPNTRGGPAGLTRAIRLPHATALVVGTIIGASIFVQPSEVTGRLPSLEGVVLLWTVAGLLTLFGCLVTAEFSAALPESGGVYAYLREAYSPLLGFLWGWAMFWTMHSGILAAVAVIFARYVAYFAPLTDAGIRGVAILAILLLSAVNVAGVRQGSRLQTAFTAGKVGAILLVVAVSFALGPAEHDPSRAAESAAESAAGSPAGTVVVSTAAAMADAGARAAPGFGFGPDDFLLALVAGLFAFGGWHMVTYSAEETVAPRRTIPRSLLLGIGVVTLCYVALNAAYLYVLPLERVIASDRVAAEAANAVLGRGGGATMSALVIFSTFGALAGIVLAGPRVYYAMARDGLLFRWLGAVHPTRRTPHRAIALQALWSSVLVWTGTYRALFTRVIYTEWIFFGLLGIGLLLHHGRPGSTGRSGTPAQTGEGGSARSAIPPPAPLYAPWAYPWVPILFALSAFAVVANQVASDPGESAVGLGFVLLGIPAYFLARRSRREARHRAGAANA